MPDAPPAREIVPAKLNLALHVRGRLPDGRHAIETIFAFCTDGDRLSAAPSAALSLEITGPFADGLSNRDDNLVIRAALALRDAAGLSDGAAIQLTKNLPIASGLGGGSADAAATLRLLTGMWRIDPRHAVAVAPGLGSDVPACLLSLPARGEGAGDRLTSIVLPDVCGTPVLLVNPRVPLPTAEVFARWDGVDRGPLGDWRAGRNDLYPPARLLAPELGSVMRWMEDLRGCTFARMSGSGATCFAMFDDECARDAADEAVPSEWWRLATYLR